MERLRLCSIAVCGKPATTVCLKDVEKQSLCKDHAFPLLEKGYTVIGIDGDDFVLSVSDVPVYKERKALAAKGLGTVTALEVACDSELNAALAVLETEETKAVATVKARFDEMKLAARKRCEEVKRQLTDMQTNFSDFVTAKDVSLSPAALLACCDLWVSPALLRVAVADSTEEIARVLLDGWTLADAEVQHSLQCLDATQKHSLAASELKTAAKQAKKGILEALKVADSLVGESPSFALESETVQVELLQWEKARRTSSLEWLQWSWELRQRYNITDEGTIEVGLRLANLYSLDCGQYLKAEEILRSCYDSVHKEAPYSTVSISLCNEICSVYFASGRYDLAETCGKWVLQTFDAADLAPEHYWTALLYVTTSMRMLDKNNEASELLRYWRERETRSDNKLAEMLRLLTCGIGADYDGDKSEAEKCLRRATRIGASHFPTSRFTALSWSRLAAVVEESAREHCRRQAQRIYEAVAPKSTEAANNLCNLGLLLDNSRRWSEEEECFKQAQSIYQVAAPKSIEAAINLNNLGKLYYDCKRLGEAEECYKQALSIYEVAAPQSVPNGNNFLSLGVLFEAKGQKAESIECLAKAAQVFAEIGEIAAQSEVEERLLTLTKPRTK